MQGLRRLIRDLLRAKQPVFSVNSRGVNLVAPNGAPTTYTQN